MIFPISVCGTYHEVLFDPQKLVRGNSVMVPVGQSASVRTFTVAVDYNPSIGRVIVHSPGSRILRDINPRAIVAVSA